MCVCVSTEEDNREKGKLYKPQAKHDEKPNEKLIEVAKIPLIVSASSNASKKESASKKGKTQEKKKSNLELFKEELRQ